MQEEGISLKKIVLIFVPVIIFSFLISGCNQKVEQQDQKSTPQLNLPFQNLSPQTNNHTTVAKATVGNTTEIDTPELNNIKNTKYPDVVAEVGNSKITGLQLAREVAIKQNAFVNNIKKPQEELFYEKVALGLLVKNALIDEEVKKQGMMVTPEEAKSYLEQQKKSMDSLPDSDPAKVAYIKTIKANGFDNASDYLNSPGVISVTQTILGRGKLKNSILQSIPQAQNEATKAWNDYTDKLINQGNFKIYVPVDIKGYQQLEEKVVLGK